MDLTQSLGHSCLLLLLCAVAGCSVKAQKSTGQTSAENIYYQTHLEALYEAVQQQYYHPNTGFYAEEPGIDHPKKYSYLWPLCGLLQANEVAQKAQLPQTVNGTLAIIGHYYDDRPPTPGYASYMPALGGGDRFYDDNQWIGIALMDAYFSKPQKDYLEKSKMIYRFMMTAYDTVSGGGLYWEEGKWNTKNTCSNGPGIILALQLYKATGEKPYLDTALLLYDWVNSHLENGEGLYYDNLNVKQHTIGKHFFSYNTGTMLQSNVYLFELTGEHRYLEEAIRLAGSSAAYFCGAGKFRDGYWFNAVLLRGYQHLFKHHKDKTYLEAFATCTRHALDENRLDNHLMGKPEKNTPFSLVDQAGMLEILGRLAIIEK